MAVQVVKGVSVNDGNSDNVLRGIWSVSKSECVWRKIKLPR